MLTLEPVGTGHRPPWWRTLPYTLIAGFMGLASVSISSWSYAASTQKSGGLSLLVFSFMILAVALPHTLWWRHRHPFVVCIIAALVPVVVPVGNWTALIALAALTGRRRGPAVRATTALVAVTTSWVTIADMLAQPRVASFWKHLFREVNGDPHAEALFSAPEAAVVIAVGLALSVGTGMFVRSRRESLLAKHQVTQERATSTRLSDEAARRQERERIAREVHDAMGHRLSLLTLHAGALETNAEDDERVAQSAQLVRESATAAMDDLRSLLAVLRDPLGTDPTPIPLSQLSHVITESFGVGQHINSTIFISDADTASPALSRAVYRIVQELLTNARKHAPNETVFLSVEGSPTAGITIDCRNAYVGGWGSGPVGSSRGLTGITERAELLGGTTVFGLDDQGAFFRVHVEMPWINPNQ